MPYNKFFCLPGGFFCLPGTASFEHVHQQSTCTDHSSPRCRSSPVPPHVCHPALPVVCHPALPVVCHPALLVVCHPALPAVGCAQIERAEGVGEVHAVVGENFFVTTECHSLASPRWVPYSPPACLPACLPACVLACLRACLPACLPACVLARLLACVSACLLALQGHTCCTSNGPERTLRICRHCKLKFVGGAFRCAQHITCWKGLKRKDIRLCKAPIPSADRGAVRELYEGKHARREGKKKAEEMAIEACAGGAKKQCIDDFYGEGASCAKESADDAICLMWAALHLPEHLADHPLWRNCRTLSQWIRPPVLLLLCAL
ncbi:unnamed protein product [Closterium sp. NIES-64]|nr:unnamed protein product [Closterium sp. NIES-64]